MLYVWAGILIVVLFLVWQIVRWINLPETIEERRKAQEARSKAWAEWRAQRPRIFKRIQAPAPVSPEAPATPKEHDTIKMPLEKPVEKPPRRSSRRRQPKEK
jgi:hypothetical protein